MGYSSRQEVIIALANALTSGNPVGGVGTTSPITSVGKSITDTLTDSDLYQYIRWADMNIDGRLSNIYRVPLKRVNLGSFELAADVTIGDQQAVLQDATRFIVDDIVVVRDGASVQQLTVDNIPNENTLHFSTPFIVGFLSTSAKIERIGYPDPIPKISARIAASHLYDKFFAAQVDGNRSEFGKVLRDQANQDMNEILSGSITLSVPDAADLIGRRFYNPALDDAFSTRAKPNESRYKEQ